MAKKWRQLSRKPGGGGETPRGRLSSFPDYVFGGLLARAAVISCVGHRGEGRST